MEDYWDSRRRQPTTTVEATEVPSPNPFLDIVSTVADLGQAMAQITIPRANLLARDMVSVQNLSGLVGRLDYVEDSQTPTPEPPPDPFQLLAEGFHRLGVRVALSRTSSFTGGESLSLTFEGASDSRVEINLLANQIRIILNRVIDLG